MFRRIALFAFALITVTAASFAQTLSMGIGPGTPNGSDFALAATRTDIDLVGPASATGSVTTARFFWQSSTCSNAVKIKFFRRNGTNISLVADRGPFTPVLGENTVALSPAVAVEEGDLIGLSRIAPCGNPGAFVGIVTAGSLLYSGDFAGTATFASGTRRAEELSVGASGTVSERVAGVLPVVGSTAGSFGSNFKTSLQLANGFTFGVTPVTGRLVLRRQGVPGSDADPSIPFSIPPGNVVTFNDIVGSFGFTGLGSIDLILPGSEQMPVVVARVFNDAGLALGTAGFSEFPTGLSGNAATAPSAAFLSAGVTAVMITPSDPSRTRFNIGVRAFGSGASLTATLRNANGSVAATVTKTYLPNSFEQVSAESFFGGGITIGANQSISISIGDGSAVVYGATTDNITNDPAVQYAIPVFAIA